ncbi:MAG: hypothetical protein KC656_20695 [Myxococcales bacterium]|nr:hypothetical protein [Myxococcales bacterium]
MLALLACHPALDRPADTCASCHAPESEAWRASLHATADRTPAFAEALRRAQDPWCHTCHLPGTGVGCASCHGPAGRTCEQCHQFDLPGTAVASQDTAREHAASSFASTPCTGCHDPHLAPGAHDAERVRAALSVDVRGTEAVVTSHGVGHALPTGDPFRRLVLEVCADLACRRVIDVHTLERALRESPEGWSVRNDSRVPPPVEGPDSTVRFAVAEGRAWRLWYRYTDPRHREVAESLLVDGGIVRSSR